MRLWLKVIDVYQMLKVIDIHDFYFNLVLCEILLKGSMTWKSRKTLTGVATINNVPCVVFLNFGVEPQSAVGRIHDLRTDYSK